LARQSLDSVARVRFITLTRAPEGWQDTRTAVFRWLERLRRAGYSMHVLWVVEKGDDTGMKHVHAVQWGDFIPKGVVRYVAKGIDGDGESVEQHMNLNGGRAAHWSREFFGGMGRNAFREAHPMPGRYFVETAMKAEA
jgi:hypothetical protein